MTTKKHNHKRTTSGARKVNHINGIRLAKEQRQAERDEFMKQRAIKLTIEQNMDKKDASLLSRACDLVDEWQQRDTDKRFAVVITSHENGYHIERFYKGETNADALRYLLFLAVPFECDPTMLAHLRMVHDIVEENIDKLRKAYAEGADPSDVTPVIPKDYADELPECFQQIEELKRIESHANNPD